MSDRKRSKDPPPPPDDPRYLRTCTRCGLVRQWIVCICECGCPEFSIPEEGLSDERTS